MIVWIVVVAVSGWNTLAQDAVPAETKEAFRFGSFTKPSAWAENDKRTNEFLSEYFDSANRYKNSIALVILRGSLNDIVDRRLQLDRAAYALKFESIRLRYKVVRSDTDAPTEFWILPANATAPSVDSEAWVGLTPKEGVEREIRKELKDFFDMAFHLRGEIQYYIINYGQPSFIARRERLFRDVLYRTPEFPEPRITFVNGGTAKPNSTNIWLVPHGAKNPTP